MRKYKYIIWRMNKLITILLSILCLISSCKTIQYVPIKGDTQIEYRDTTIYKDSIVYTPIEVVKEVVPYMEPLYMETSLAKAEAHIDTTTRTLKGKIENKKGITEKIKYKEKIVYRDSIVTQEVPVEVEVEKEVKVHPWYERILWFLSVIGCTSIIYIGYRIYVKTRKLL